MKHLYTFAMYFTGNKEGKHKSISSMDKVEKPPARKDQDGQVQYFRITY